MDGWIKIEDRLPDNVGEYIVCAIDGISQYAERIRYRQIVTLAKYGLDEWIWHENGIEWDISGIVTHWMPLPDPPQMEGKNEHIVCQ